MRVLGYIRVSTNKQKESGLGLEDQEKKIKLYCELHGHKLVAIYVDTCSGKDLERDDLNSALACLKRGEADGLLVVNLERLTRSTENLPYLLRTYFKKYDLFSVEDHIDTRTAGGRLILNLRTAISQWEREVIGERTAAAMSIKRSRGEKTGGHVPYGYKQIEGKLVEVKKEQVILKLVKEKRNAGHTFQSIADHLNSLNEKTKLGHTWSRAHVRNACVRVS